MAKVLVIDARPFDFNDKQTGRPVRGVTVWYTYGPDEQATASPGGWPVFKETMPAGTPVPPLPAYCELETRKVPGLGGKPVDKLSSLRFVAPFGMVFGETLAMQLDLQSLQSKGAA